MPRYAALARVRPNRAPILELSTTPGHLVRRAQQVHTSLWTQRLGGELTGPQYAVLVALAAEPDSDQMRLGTLASLDKNTTADIVRRLVDRGWAVRSPDPADGRRRLVRLTSAAVTALTHITPAAALVQVDLLAPVPPEARDSLVRDLASVAFGTASRPATPETATAPLLDMASTPGYLIRRIQQLHTSLWTQLVGTTITGPQYAVLVAIATQSGLDQVSAGRLASLDRSTTAEVVGRLVRDGWVLSGRDPADGRRQVLELAPASRTRLAEVTPSAQRVQDRLLSGLDAGRGAEFTRRLACIAYREPAEIPLVTHVKMPAWR